VTCQFMAGVGQQALHAGAFGFKSDEGWLEMQTKSACD